MSGRENIKTNIKFKIRQELDDKFTETLARAYAALAEADKARDRALRGDAEAERAIAKADRAYNEAIRIAEALKESIAAEKASADGLSARVKLGGHEPTVNSSTRDLLVKALGMLGSDQVGERAAAALMAERQRMKLGMTWNELIVNEQDEEDFDDDDLDDNDDCDLDEDDLDDDELDDDDDLED